MEGAARDHRVVMGSMSVGWSDIGSWTALLDGLAGRASGATGRVVQPGDTISAGPNDLVVRSLDGRLIVDEPPAGPAIADGVWAHLSGARPLGDEIRAMIDRVQREEVRS